MYDCMDVCMYLRTCVWMYERVGSCVCILEHVHCSFICAHTCTCIRAHTYLRTHTQIYPSEHVSSHASMPVCTDTCTPETHTDTNILYMYISTHDFCLPHEQTINYIHAYRTPAHAHARSRTRRLMQTYRQKWTTTYKTTK